MTVGGRVRRGRHAAISLARRRLGRLAYHSVRRSAAVYRQRLVHRIAATPVRAEPVDVTLVTMTGHRDLPQAAAMLLSFRRWVGQPAELRVIDDGSLTPQDAALLRSIMPVVEVLDTSPEASEAVAPGLGDFVRQMWTGRKLAGIVQSSRGSTRTLVYVDSDVLFLPAADTFAAMFDGPITTPWFTTDGNWSGLDSRYERDQHPPVCAGFVVLPPKFDWTFALEQTTPWFTAAEHFTDQTTVHIAISHGESHRLDPAFHVLEYSDYHSLRDIADRPGVVQRHYVSPIRWKFWVRAFGGYRRWLGAILVPQWAPRFRR